VWSDGIGDWFNDTLIDPEDGMLDASDYLDSASGYLPIPIIITEPAVGFGLGVAVAYFHAPKVLDAEEHPHHGPPSISVGFGAKTDNGTYLYGGAHMGVWKNDHIRYMGALAKMNVNMSFYLDGQGDRLRQDLEIKFNIDGTFLLQDVKFRLKESNWWLGANYLYVNAENTFKLSETLPPGLPDPQFDFDLAGLGVFVEYDGRNTVFTPTQGLSAKFTYKNFDDNWGSDYDYDDYKGSLFHTHPLATIPALVCELRLKQSVATRRFLLTHLSICGVFRPCATRGKMPSPSRPNTCGDSTHAGHWYYLPGPDGFHLSTYLMKQVRPSVQAGWGFATALPGGKACRQVLILPVGLKTPRFI